MARRILNEFELARCVRCPIRISEITVLHGVLLNTVINLNEVSEFSFSTEFKVGLSVRLK